jgi:hypothetical protein
LVPLAGQENERRENGLGFLEAHVDLAAVSAVPVECCPSETLGRLVAQDDAELERFAQADVLELGRR